MLLRNTRSLLTAALSSARGAAAEASPPPAPAWTPPVPPGTRVGPGHVLEVLPDGRPRVLLPDGREVRPEWGIPFRYAPAPGDALLVLARGERAYVLGVVHGRGRAELAFRGDARIGARGRLRLRAGRALEIAGETLELRGRTLEVVAATLHEKATDAVRTVRGLLEVRAGSCRRVTEDEETTTAGRVTVAAADSVTYDGDVLVVQ